MDAPTTTMPHPQHGPTKLCPHCGAVSQTTARKCPNCGRGYRKRTVLKVLAGLTIAGVLMIGGCTALLAAGVEEAQDESDRNGISLATYRAIEIGMSRDEVEEIVGDVAPASEDDFETQILDEQVGTDCVYYNRIGELVSGFQLCFDKESGRLEFKNSF